MPLKKTDHKKDSKLPSLSIFFVSISWHHIYNSGHLSRLHRWFYKYLPQKSKSEYAQKKLLTKLPSLKALSHRTQHTQRCVLKPIRVYNGFLLRRAKCSTGQRDTCFEMTRNGHLQYTQSTSFTNQLSYLLAFLNCCIIFKTFTTQLLFNINLKFSLSLFFQVYYPLQNSELVKTRMEQHLRPSRPQQFI